MMTFREHLTPHGFLHPVVSVDPCGFVGPIGKPFKGWVILHW